MSTTPLRTKQWFIKTAGPNIRETTELIEVDVPELKPDQVLIKTHYVGCNASDLNLACGNYGILPPFVAGFEAVGEIAKIGADVTNFKVGAAVYYFTVSGAFSQYIVAPEAAVFPVPAIAPEYLTPFISGCTAAVAFEVFPELLQPGKTVFVTAAAGGTGVFAVQLAKMAGCHVIGTCGSDAKVDFLKELGCDRVINYKKEDLREVLQKEYPKGVDTVYESVGGKTLETCIDNIAIGGNILLIGFVSNYLDQTFKTTHANTTGFPVEFKLLGKSASLRGFLLLNHMPLLMPNALKMIEWYQQGKMKLVVDVAFKGFEHILDAIDYLYEGKNKGKVAVDIRQ